MRLVMSGDKSRYHFFRSIVDLNRSKNQENFFTERLSEREVFLTSDLYKVNDETFYSPKVPLNTELFFPSEFSLISDVIKNEDKIIWFDEFPYATDKDIGRLKEILDSGKCSQIVIVLFQNSRECLETDISTNAMALEDAKERYVQFNVSIYNYTPNSLPYFLFWENDSGSVRLEKNFFSKMKSVEWSLEIFDSSYEFMLDFPGDDGESIASEIDFDVLAYFCDYDRKLIKNNIWEIFHEKACKYYWENNIKIKNFCKLIYKDTIEPVCIWDFETDFERLYASIIEKFKKILAEMKLLEYSGEIADYDEFLIDNQEEIIKYKTKIQLFFRKELREIIKDRVQINLRKLEALFSW